MTHRTTTLLAKCVGAPVGLLGLCSAVMSIGAAPHATVAPADAAIARQIVEATGVRGGLIVHLGCGDGRLTAALRVSDAYLVQGLDADAGRVATARQHVLALGLHGPVSIDRCSGNHLPYIDQLVNLLVAEDPGAISQDEMMRVLAPQGVAYVKSGDRWTKTVKPRPAELDEWSHYLYDASNNAVAHDTLVGPPRHMQWVAGPNWARHHDHMGSLSALVSARGRIFYIMDEGPREAILLPAKWSLIARDAYSGTLLWKRPIAEWNTHLWPLKSGPNQLPRRLVAVGDRVYVTLGIDAPLTALDAATGQTVLTYAGTDHADEVIASDGVLFALVARSPNKWKDYRPKFTYVWDNTTRANRDWAWDRELRWVMAVQADTGTVLWKHEQRVAPLTLAADAERVFLYDGEKVVSLNRKTGQVLWNSEPVARKLPFPTGYGPTLVVQQGVVLLSVENRSMTALSATDGTKLWAAPKHHGGHASPDDLLVINGLVWSGAVAATGDSGVFTSRDLRTGEVKREFPPDVKPDWFHHRCYRSRATGKYFIASRTGIEFIDLEAQHWDFNHWVRGGCLYGFLPSNGLLYAPPHACGCFLESKLFGFQALAPGKGAKDEGRRAKDEGRRAKDEGQKTKDEGQRMKDEGRREQGPASEISDLRSQIQHAGDWPTYRHDAARSGSVKTVVPTALKRSWQVDLGGRLSSVTIADGKLFVAAVDRHTVYALDANTGKIVWCYTAGGRVDSPPTVHRGRVLFGSGDGWVYCLAAADGRLSWRFRAAPAERRLVAYEQIESAWPVSGSVLVEKDAVYCVAGRSAFLDGGLRLVRLDPQTGRKLSETILDDRVPETGENLQSQMQGQDMPVALPDILSSDGRSVYMRNQAFDLEGGRRGVAPRKLGAGARRRAAAPAADEPEIGNHLFSRTGFLDDSWFFRSYWLYGKAVDSNYCGWPRPGSFAPSGRLLVFDDARIYGFARKPEFMCNASAQEYYLYGADRTVGDEAIERVRAATARINASSPSRGAASSDWAARKRFSLSELNVAGFQWAQAKPPIQARAMVLADQVLFVAGPPDVVDEEAALRNPDDPAIVAALEAQAEALQGHRGGQLLAFSAADGRPLAAYELGAMPIFDGMAAAQGRLYLTTVDGRVLCLGGAGDPLPAAPAADLSPLDVTVKTTAVEPVHGADGPSARGDFAHVASAQVTKAELGYRVRGAEKKLGVALKKLPAPVEGKVQFKVRMKVLAGSNLKNGFLVFGDGTADAELVKCGLCILMRKAIVVQGTLGEGQTTDAAYDADAAQVHQIAVTVDVQSGAVELKVGAATVTAKLEPRLPRISYVGYGVLNATVDFSAVELGQK